MTEAERNLPPPDGGDAPKEIAERSEAMMKSGAIDTQPRDFCNAFGAWFRYFVVGDPAKADRIPSHCDLPNEWPSNVFHTFKLLSDSWKDISLTRDDLRKITAPVLVIHGTKDRNAPYVGGVNWSKSLPNARLVTIEGAAHGVLWEEPDRVMDAIRQFIAGNH
jgi:pimeloyl-ACP methyl ester carboxylesterase